MKYLLVIIFYLSLTVSRGQTPTKYIESINRTQWKLVGSDTAVYLIQKDPYQPRLTRMVWVNKKQVVGIKLKLYSVTQMDSIRATQ